MRYFNLFSNILITKGASRILISDLQRNLSELYPLEFYDLIEELKMQSVEDVIKGYDEDSKEIVLEYLDVLLQEEFGFITQNNWDKNFPPLSYEFIDYNILSNIFLELDNLKVLNKIRQSIESLEIKHMVIYAKNDLDAEDLLEIDRKFENSPLEGIEIYSPFHDGINENLIQKLNNKTSRIYNLVFYGCKQAPFNIKDDYRFTLHFTDQDLKISSCGKVNLDYFNTNLPKVLEAMNYNSCLHKKISIDSEGNIRNCPSMTESFGNIKNTTLEEALHNKAFKKYWNLTKDKIEVCKDCEFRYICTDCRAYTERTHEDKEGLDVSKPLKCGYNPYIGEWQDWSTNPLKQKAIKYYGMEKMIKN